ncbi:hypothetical protein GCM10020256_33840 [Streptomyces thermocoprophilus]
MAEHSGRAAQQQRQRHPAGRQCRDQEAADGGERAAHGGVTTAAAGTDEGNSLATPGIAGSSGMSLGIGAVMPPNGRKKGVYGAMRVGHVGEGGTEGRLRRPLARSWLSSGARSRLWFGARSWLSSAALPWLSSGVCGWGGRVAVAQVSFATSVSSVASGGHAKRNGV